MNNAGKSSTKEKYIRGKASLVNKSTRVESSKKLSKMCLRTLTDAERSHPRATSARIHKHVEFIDVTTSFQLETRRIVRTGLECIRRKVDESLLVVATSASFTLSAFKFAPRQHSSKI